MHGLCSIGSWAQTSPLSLSLRSDYLTAQSVQFNMMSVALLRRSACVVVLNTVNCSMDPTAVS